MSLGSAAIDLGDRAPAQMRPAEMVNLAELVAILRAEVRSVALVVALVLAVAILYVALAPPQYRATTALLLDPRGGTSLSADAVIRQAIDTSVVESQVKLVASPAVLRRVVERERLDEDPAFVGGTGLGSRLRALVGLQRATPTREETVQATVVALAERLTVRRSERTLVVEIEAWARDPALAARLANGVADAFIADQIEAKAAASSTEGTWIRRRLGELEGEIRAAEARAEAYKTENRIVSANGRLVNEQQLESTAGEFARAQARTLEARSRLDQIQAAMRRGADPGATGDALRSLVVQQLRAQYAEVKRQQDALATTLGSRHPALKESNQQLAGVRTQIDAELRRLAEAQRGEVQVAEANEGLLKRQVEDQKRDASRTNQSILRLRELERGVESSRAVYDRFLRANGNLAQEGVDTPVARVIAPAFPPTRAARPDPRATMLIALALALAGGLATAILRHRARTARRWDRVVPPALRPAFAPAPFVPPPPTGPPPVADAPPPVADEARGAFRRIAVLPRLGPVAAGGAGPFGPAGEAARLHEVLTRPGSAFSRAVRSVEARLPAGTTLLITSEAAGAGRTTVAANLALAAAGSGLRVLLVDASEEDTLSRLVPQGDGARRAPFAGSWRPVHALEGAGDLSFMPRRSALGRRAGAGDGRPVAAFDLVVVDGPPIGAVDAALLAAATRTLFVQPGDGRDAFAALVLAEERETAGA